MSPALAGRFLTIGPQGSLCVDFLKEQADASNCLSLSVLAECLDCPELRATADDFIHQHFIELYKTDECLQLDAKQVTHLLNQDTLTVRAEDQASLVAQTVKNPPAMLEAWVGSLSKFAGILSAALSQYHLSGFEIAPLEFHHLH